MVLLSVIHTPFLSTKMALNNTAILANQLFYYSIWLRAILFVVLVVGPMLPWTLLSQGVRKVTLIIALHSQ